MWVCCYLDVYVRVYVCVYILCAVGHVVTYICSLVKSHIAIIYQIPKRLYIATVVLEWENWLTKIPEFGVSCFILISTIEETSANCSSSEDTHLWYIDHLYDRCLAVNTCIIIFNAVSFPPCDEYHFTLIFSGVTSNQHIAGYSMRIACLLPERWNSHYN